MKERFNISPLKSVETILEEFEFLQYCTQKRNLAYQIQFLEFLKELNSNYEIDRGLRSIFIRQIVICTTNIIEYLLYVTLYQEYGVVINNDRINNLIAQSKTKGLITKPLSKGLELLAKKRNKLHPKKQIELDAKDFDENDLQGCLDSIPLLINELSNYYKPKNEVVNRFYQDGFCPYCFPGGPFGNVGNTCPGCKRIVF
jgi:hypothetical protein